MAQREIFRHDPVYEERYTRVFQQAPDRPAFEIYLPAQFLSMELDHAVMRPIWKFEVDHIWRIIVEELVRDGVKGDFVEFGVFAGASLARLLKIFRGTGVIRKFWGFDSFEGLPEPEAGVDQVVFKHGQYRTTRTEAEAKIRADANGVEEIELVEGWFSESLPRYQDKITTIAFCRIDCDLYSSSRDCLKFLKGRLIDGSILYFDDWTHDASTGETKAFFEFAEDTRELYSFESIVTVSKSAFGVRVRLQGSGDVKGTAT